MEYRKGTDGFTLEFNKEEEHHFERFALELKSHEEFSDLTSESEILALIINEGVASLRYKLTRMGEGADSEGHLVLPDFLAAMLNESLAALMQYKPSTHADEQGYAVSLDDIMSLMPDLGQLFNHPEQLMEEEKPLPSLEAPLSEQPNEVETPKNIG